jgi:hypothetical protein
MVAWSASRTIFSPPMLPFSRVLVPRQVGGRWESQLEPYHRDVQHLLPP